MADELQDLLELLLRNGLVVEFYPRREGKFGCEMFDAMGFGCGEAYSPLGALKKAFDAMQEPLVPTSGK